jgi:hypothetical protein
MFSLKLTESAREQLAKHLITEPTKSIRLFISGAG